MPIKCPHDCECKLVEDEKAKKNGRHNVFVCPKCGCKWGFVTIRQMPKCVAKRDKRAKREENKKSRKNGKNRRPM